MRERLSEAVKDIFLLFRTDKKAFFRRFIPLLFACAYFAGLYEVVILRGIWRFGLFVNVLAGILYKPLWVIFLVAMVFLIIQIYKGHMEKTREEERFKYKVSDKSTVYGGCRWATKAEIACMVKETPPNAVKSGMIIGESLYEKGKVYVWDKPEGIGNGHTLIIGSSGRGKTGSMTYNMMLQDLMMGRSAIVSDPSGDVVMRCYAQAKRMLGENVYLINWSEAEAFLHSDGYNMLSIINVKDRTNCMAQAAEIADVFRRNGLESADHWSKVTEQLCEALILYVAEEAYLYEDQERREKVGSLSHMLDILNWTDDELQALMAQVPETSVARKFAEYFANSPDYDRKAARTNLFSIIKIITAEAVGEALSHNDINLSDFARKQCALFMIFPIKEGPYDILTSVFFSQLFGVLEHEAKKNFPANTLKVPVHLILDEFPSLGVIPSFQNVIATIRKYGIFITLMVQDISQVYKRYGQHDANSILGQCDVKICLGVNDQVTQEWVQKTFGVGDTTFEIETETDMVYRGIGLKGRRASVRTQLVPGKLMPTDMIRTMNDDPLASLVCIGTGRPFMAHKFFYKNHPLYENIKPYNAAEHTPRYMDRLRRRT